MSFFSALGSIAGSAIGSFFNAPQVGAAIGSAAGSFFDGPSSSSSGGGAASTNRAIVGQGLATRAAIRGEGVRSRTQSLLDKSTESAQRRQNAITNKSGSGYDAPNAIQPTGAVKSVESINPTIANVYKQAALIADRNTGKDEAAMKFKRQMDAFSKENMGRQTYNGGA